MCIRVFVVPEGRRTTRGWGGGGGTTRRGAGLCAWGRDGRVCTHTNSHPTVAPLLLCDSLLGRCFTADEMKKTQRNVSEGHAPG